MTRVGSLHPSVEAPYSDLKELTLTELAEVNVSPSAKIDGWRMA
jgi:hypothetical protein